MCFAADRLCSVCTQHSEQSFPSLGLYRKKKSSRALEIGGLFAVFAQ